MADADVVVSYIGRKGWHTEPVPGGWRVTTDGGLAGSTPVYLAFTPSWVCLQAPLDAYLPGTESAWSDEQRAQIHRYLLQCNESMFMAKFCRDRAGRLLLQAELPHTTSLHRMDYALEALARYLALYGPALSEPGRLVAPSGADRTAKELYFEDPPGIPPEVVAYFLRAVEPRGWGARSKPKGITWLLVYKGQRLFDAYLTVTRSWAAFHVPALLSVPVTNPSAGLAAQQVLLEYLLMVNDTWFMAKTGLDEAGRVLVMLEVPTPELDFEKFRTVTGLLATYLDLYAREIQIMAHLPSDPHLADRLALR